MSDFLERLTGIIHWIGFLITLLISYLYLTEPANIETSLKIAIALMPNTVGWLIKYIFTGNGKFFPF